MFEDQVNIADINPMVNNIQLLRSGLQAIALPYIKIVLCSLAAMTASQLHAQGAAQFARTLAVHGPVTLEVDIPKGEITIVQGSEDHVVITAGPQTVRTRPDSNPVIPSVTVEQNGAHILVSYAYDHAAAELANMSLRIEAPRRAEVISTIGNGNLTMVGVDGPIQANMTMGHVNISHALNNVSVQLKDGEVEIEAVSGQVKASVIRGNISCTRVPDKVVAETGEGDITLRVVGPAEARVRKGGGWIDVGGARSTLMATTDSGDLHVKAVPHQDWQLSSASGGIRIEVPEAAAFEIDASTKAGSISVQRQDVDNKAGNELVQKVNGGGKKIQIRNQQGNIIIQ